MQRFSLCKCALPVLLSSIGFGLSGPMSHAETLDQVVNPRRASHAWVSDMAHIIDSKTEQRLNQISDRLEQKTATELAIVTIARTDGKTPKQFSTALFNKWGIGKKKQNNGVLFLVVLDAHRVEVETGRGMQSMLPNARVQDILQAQVIPAFKQDEYSRGILQGATVLAQDIYGARQADSRRDSPAIAASTTAPNAASTHAGINKSATSPSPRPDARENPSIFHRPPNMSPAMGSSEHEEDLLKTPPNEFTIGLVFIVLGLGIWLVGSCRTKNCPHCKHKMRRLQGDDVRTNLNAAEQFEMNVGSADYSAWHCASCKKSFINRKPIPASGYRECPKCHHSTLTSRRTVLKHPTYTEEGAASETFKCFLPGCGYEKTHESVIKTLRPPLNSSADYRHRAHIHYGTAASHILHDTSHSSTSHSTSHSTFFGGDSGASFGGDSGASFGGGSSDGGGGGASW
jgi:uncharacterized protein